VGARRSCATGWWANLRGAELAQFTGDTIPEVAGRAQHGIRRVCDSDTLVVGFLAHTGLSLHDEPSPNVKESIRYSFPNMRYRTLPT
jgi:hypothetical protein